MKSLIHAKYPYVCSAYTHMPTCMHAYIHTYIHTSNCTGVQEDLDARNEVINLLQKCIHAYIHTHNKIAGVQEDLNARNEVTNLLQKCIYAYIYTYIHTTKLQVSKRI
jgi:hypothetical protein